MAMPQPPSIVVFLISLALLLGCGTPADQPKRLTSRDSSAIDSVRAAYVSAWLRDDTAGVLATLDSSAVLLPPGRLPVIGHQKIREFWWPDDGSHTTITAFDWAVEELNGTLDLAFTRGVSNLKWRYQKDTLRMEQTTRNTNLTIFAPGPDGRWRIVRQMWGPPLPGS